MNGRYDPQRVLTFFIFDDFAPPGHPLVPCRGAYYHPPIMAIRFTCPSCNQPLEVDDAWAGQTVGCPYCRRVATTPMSSTWSGAEIRMASPAGPPPASAFAPPPPPMGYPADGRAPAAPSSPRPGGASAVSAFVLTLVGMLLAFAGYLALIGSWGMAAQQKAGTNATQRELEETLREMMVSGQLQLVPTISVAFFIIGLLFGATGLILAIRALLRQEAGRGFAIAACVLGAFITLCQVLPILGAISARSAFGQG